MSKPIVMERQFNAFHHNGIFQRFSPDMTPEDPIVMESIKLALAK